MRTINILRSRFLLVPLLLAAAASPALAQSNLVTWFVYNGYSSLNYRPTNYVAAGIWASDFTMGTGVQQVNDANTMTAQGFNQTSYSSALLNGDYFQFTVSPGANTTSWN